MNILHLKIMGHDWVVKRVIPAIIKEAGENNNTLGLCAFPSREIYIHEELSGEQLDQVVTHEVVHAILGEFGFSTLNDYGQEFVCDFFANNYKIILELKENIIKELFKKE